MKFLFHNKSEIKIGNKTVIFFNKLLNSIFDKLKSFDSYFNFVQVGDGFNNNAEANHHLASKLASYKLVNDEACFNPQDNILFSKKYAIINDSKLDGKILTEMGICANDQNNEPVYNYFSLKNEIYPNGITKVKGESIEISICIYLEIQSEGIGLLTAGENPFIKFLLGEGTNNKSFYATRGDIYLDNSKMIERERPHNSERFPCSISVTNNSSLTLNISADLYCGEVHEVVLLLGDEPFARMNIEKQRNPILTTSTFTSKTNYVVDLGKNIDQVSSVTNTNTNVAETNIFCSKYATDFGDKISLPFENLFDSETPRFLSKDGNKIFFVVDDKIYAYKNENLSIYKIKTNGAQIQNIKKIVAFDKYVFVCSKSKPYLSAFVIENNEFANAEIDFSEYENIDDFSEIFDIDITLAKNNIFMLGYISKTNYKGFVIYFSFDSATKTFNFDSYQTSDYSFTYVVAMYKNNFSDASIFFLKGDKFSYNCQIVTYLPDKTFHDEYTVLCYYYTFETKEIYTKGRAVVVEKTSSPHMWIYFYPQKYRYNLELLGDELDDYLSTNMLYLIQKKTENYYKIYNLVGYNTPTEFENGFPSELDQSKIKSFEFLDDSLLIFTSDEKEKICAYNLKQDSMLVENVSSNSDTYSISYNKLNLLGQNNEGVVVTMTIKIDIWFFLIKFTNFQKVKILLYFQKVKMLWLCFCLMRVYVDEKLCLTKL